MKSLKLLALIVCILMTGAGLYAFWMVEGVPFHLKAFLVVGLLGLFFIHQFWEITITSRNVNESDFDSTITTEQVDELHTTNPSDRDPYRTDKSDDSVRQNQSVGNVNI